MNLFDFLNSYAGMYLVQSFVHSLITAIVVDRSIHAWRILNPLIIQRFRLLVILLPILSFPLFQWIDPERSAIDFRLRALFDSARWLNLELFGVLPVRLLFVGLLLATCVVFLVQELIPLVRHTFLSRKSAVPETRAEEHTSVAQALEGLPGEKPAVYLMNDDAFTVLSTTGSDSAIFLSTGLLEILGPSEVQAAIAHEIAHIQRSKRPLLVLVYLFRMLMFLNPVVLLEFRRIVQEEENICDDMAVSMTRNPQALANTLRSVHGSTQEAAVAGLGKLAAVSEALEDYSHRLLIEKRIGRLTEARSDGATERGRLGWVLTAAAVLVINYYVV
jgi:Zn-dependent protease with chaperone function